MSQIDPTDDPINQPGVFPRSKIPLEVQYRREAEQDLRSPAIRSRALGMTMFAGTGWLGSLVTLALAVVAGLLKRPSTSLAVAALALLIFNVMLVGLWVWLYLMHEPDLAPRWRGLLILMPASAAGCCGLALGILNLLGTW